MEPLLLAFDDHSRIPGGDAIRRHVLGDDRAGSNNGAISNGHSLEDDALRADEDVIADADGLGGTVIAAARAAADFGVERVKVVIKDPHIAANVAVLTDFDSRAG